MVRLTIFDGQKNESVLGTVFQFQYVALQCVFMLRIVWNIVGYAKNPFHYVFELEELMNNSGALSQALTPDEVHAILNFRVSCSIGLLL